MALQSTAVDEEAEEGATDVMFEHFHLTAQAVLVNNPLLAEGDYDIVDLYRLVNANDVPFHNWHNWLISQLAKGAVGQSKRVAHESKRKEQKASQEDDTGLLLHGSSFIQYTKAKLGRVQKKAVSVRVTDGEKKLPAIHLLNPLSLRFSRANEKGFQPQRGNL